MRRSLAAVSRNLENKSFKNSTWIPNLLLKPKSFRLLDLSSLCNTLLLLPITCFMFSLVDGIDNGKNVFNQNYNWISPQARPWNFYCNFPNKPSHDL